MPLWLHHIAGWPLWGWPGWTPLVAVGTLGLAGFTFWLARRTNSLAQAATEDGRAQWRPVVLPDGDAVNRPALVVNERMAETAIRIRNAGRGPALNLTAELLLPNDAGPIKPGGPIGGALAVDGELTLGFSSVRFTPEGSQLRVEYDDLGGRRHRTTITIKIIDLHPEFYRVQVEENIKVK